MMGNVELSQTLTAILEVQGNILTELRFQRIAQARIMAALGIEIDDRKEGDEQLERRLKEQDRKIAHLAVVPGE